MLKTRIDLLEILLWGAVIFLVGSLIATVVRQTVAAKAPAEQTSNFSVSEEIVGPLRFYTVTEAGRTNKTVFVHASSSGTLTLFCKD